MAENFCDIFKGERLHVNLIGNYGVGHDGCRVGVYKDNLVAFFLKRKARLGSGVVEFGRLANYDRAGADDKYFFDVCSFSH